MNMRRTHFLILAAAGTLFLGGCAEFPIFDQKAPRTPSHPKAAAARPAPARTAAEREPGPQRDRDGDGVPDDAKEQNGLREGVRLYEEGDYNAAIRRLSARDVSNGPLSTRLTALKYTAFSYCVSSRPVQCRQAFDKALRLDPSFDLAPG
ncbi:MAG: TssQ family T6SS-associated lipoprotein, partial [Ramlibacter sp.]